MQYGPISSFAHQIRVFIVEDSPQIRRRIVEQLEALGSLQIVGLADGENEAVNGIAKTQPEIIITDICLKQGSGIEVVRQVRSGAKSPQPKIFVLSNYAYPEYERQCCLAGADGFFDKSLGYEYLLTAVRDATCTS